MGSFTCNNSKVLNTKCVVQVTHLQSDDSLQQPAHNATDIIVFGVLFDIRIIAYTQHIKHS